MLPLILACLPLSPPQQLGELKLGQPEAALKALERSIEPGFAPGVLDVGPYEVTIRDGRVARITYVLGADTPCVQIGADEIRVEGPLEALAARLRCGPRALREGAEIYRCEGGLELSRVKGFLEIRLGAAPLERPACAAFITPDLGVYLAGSHRARPRTDIGLGDYCLPDGQLTGTMRLKDLPVDPTCEREEHPGLTKRHCPGLTLIFEGPTRHLVHALIPRIASRPEKK